MSDYNYNDGPLPPAFRPRQTQGADSMSNEVQMHANHPAVAEAQARYERSAQEARDAALMANAGRAKAETSFNGEVQFTSDGRIIVREEVGLSASTSTLTAFPTNPTSVLDMVRTEAGYPTTGEIKPSDVVVIPALGGPISVEAAVAMGILRKTSSGYESTAKGEAMLGVRRSGFNDPAAGLRINSPSDNTQQPMQNDQPQQNADEGIPSTEDAEVDAVVAKIAPRLGSFDAEVIAAHALDSGEVPQPVIEALARKTGTPVEVVKETVGKVVSSYARQATAVLDVLGEGEDGNATDWARQHMPGELRSAALNFATKNDRSGLQEVARAYLKDLERSDPAALMAAELPGGARMIERGGRIGIALPNGQTVGWHEAIDLGWIKGVPAIRSRR